MMGMFNKGNKVGSQVDMYAGQAMSKLDNAIMTLKQSDMIEMQFTSLANMAKSMGDATMAMQFEMLKGMVDNMQNQVVMQLESAKQDLRCIDQATDTIQY